MIDRKFTEKEVREWYSSKGYTCPPPLMVLLDFFRDHDLIKVPVKKMRYAWISGGQSMGVTGLMSESMMLEWKTLMSATVVDFQCWPIPGTEMEE